jgi:hypothetical protein
MRLFCRFVPSRSPLGSVLVLFLLSFRVVGQTHPCPDPPSNPPVPGITVPAVPADVCIPKNFPWNQNPIAFFDDYSWKTFIAMVWPARPAQRGTPDAAKHVGDISGPVVFETLKQDWEIFQLDGAPPSSNWGDFGHSPCPNVAVGFGDLVLASFSKFGNLGQAGFGDLVHALPAQNGTWVRYATGFNEVEFSQISSAKFYLRSNLPAGGVTFSEGALDVKSSWIEMTNIPHSERYYTRQAWIKDPVSGNCSSAPLTVGLVGVHIVQKTPSRPQWIWSTFEHIDNVPPRDEGSPAPPFTFNKGDGTPMPGSDTNGGFPPADWMKPALYNVDRILPVNASTQATNNVYRKKLAGTVWQNYQLVMTQWPLVPNSPATPGTIRNTFPGQGATSAFTNTTLETWDQRDAKTGCMNCHNVTRTKTDFLWSLEINAFPSALGPNVFSLIAPKEKSKVRPHLPGTLDQLRSLLRAADLENKKRSTSQGRHTIGPSSKPHKDQ